MKECEEFIDFIMKVSVDLQKYEIAAWIRDIKKELAYTIIFERELSVDDFISICSKKMSVLDEKDKKIIIPHLRDLKMKILGI